MRSSPKPSRPIKRCPAGHDAQLAVEERKRHEVDPFVEQGLFGRHHHALELLAALVRGGLLFADCVRLPSPSDWSLSRLECREVKDVRLKPDLLNASG